MYGYCYIFIPYPGLYNKISIINIKDCRRLLNERNELVFKCWHKSKFKLSTEAPTPTEAPTLDKNKDIDFGWFLLEIITFISVITSYCITGGFM